MLGAQERERLIGEWSGAGRTALPPGTGEADAFRPVHELISERAARRPDAVAVTVPALHEPAHRLTYAELERRSEESARHLRGLGVGAGSVVALCLEKSPELVIALLAVLKAGGAYLPIPADHPADRVAHTVRTAGATLVVAEDDACRDRLAGLPERTLTLRELREAAPATDDLSGTGPGAAEPAGPDSTAYIIHTSGSTGLPKAVRVSHRNLASAYGAWLQEYRLDRDVRVHLQMAAPSFDVFTGDVVRALCSGGSLVLVDRDLLFDTERLYTTMRQERVDCAEFVPAVVRGLMDHCERRGLRLDFMRLLVVGSDVWKAGSTGGCTSCADRAPV